MDMPTCDVCGGELAMDPSDMSCCICTECGNRIDVRSLDKITAGGRTHGDDDTASSRERRPGNRGGDVSSKSSPRKKSGMHVAGNASSAHKTDSEGNRSASVPDVSIIGDGEAGRSGKNSAREDKVGESVGKSQIRDDAVHSNTRSSHPSYTDAMSRGNGRAHIAFGDDLDSIFAEIDAIEVPENRTPRNESGLRFDSNELDNASDTGMRGKQGSKRRRRASNTVKGASAPISANASEQDGHASRTESSDLFSELHAESHPANASMKRGGVREDALIDADDMAQGDLPTSPLPIIAIICAAISFVVWPVPVVDILGMVFAVVSVVCAMIGRMKMDDGLIKPTKLFSVSIALSIASFAISAIISALLVFTFPQALDNIVSGDFAEVLPSMQKTLGTYPDDDFDDSVAEGEIEYSEPADREEIRLYGEFDVVYSYPDRLDTSVDYEPGSPEYDELYSGEAELEGVSSQLGLLKFYRCDFDDFAEMDPSREDWYKITSKDSIVYISSFPIDMVGSFIYPLMKYSMAEDKSNYDDIMQNVSTEQFIRELLDYAVDSQSEDSEDVYDLKHLRIERVSPDAEAVPFDARGWYRGWSSAVGDHCFYLLPGKQSIEDMKKQSEESESNSDQYDWGSFDAEIQVD